MTATPTQSLRAVHGPVAVVDETLTRLADALRTLLADRVARGYADLPPSEIEMLARAIGVRARHIVGDAVFAAFQAGVNRAVTAEQHDAITRVVR